MQTPNIHAGSSLAQALSANATNLSHTRATGTQQTLGGIAFALDSLNKTYQLRKEEEQRAKDNAHRENIFAYQTRTDERNFNYQKERDAMRDKQWQQEQNLRAQSVNMQNAISNENLKTMRRQNEFLDALYKSASARYESPKEEDAQEPLFLSAQGSNATQTQATTHAPQTQSVGVGGQNPQAQSATNTRQSAGEVGHTQTNAQAQAGSAQNPKTNDYLKFAAAFHNFQPSTAQSAPQEQADSKDFKSHKEISHSLNTQQSKEEAQKNKEELRYPQPQNDKETLKDKRSTNPHHPLSYFRDKIASATPLNEVDYLSLQAMGLNPNGLGSLNANINGDMRVRKVDYSKGIQKANSALAAIDSTLSLMQDTEKNAGLLNGLDRFAHNKTLGLWGLNDHNARYRARDLANTRNIAQAEAGGKATNQDKEDAKTIYSTQARAPKTQVHTLSGALENTLYALDEGIRNIQDAGGEVPTSLILARQKAKAIDNYLKQIQAGKKSFSYKGLNNLITEFKKVVDSTSEI